MIITCFLMELFRSVTFLTMLATFPVHPLLLSNEEGFALVLSTTNREGYAVASPIDLRSITRWLLLWRSQLILIQYFESVSDHNYHDTADMFLVHPMIYIWWRCYCYCYYCYRSFQCLLRIKFFTKIEYIFWICFW